MNKQAFRNRMQQLKQYREQNPGKTYLDFKKYADGGKTKDINTERQQQQDIPTLPLKLQSWITPKNAFKWDWSDIKTKLPKVKGFGFTSALDLIDMAADEYEIQHSTNPQQTRRYRDYQTRSAIGLEDQGLEKLYKTTPKMADGGEIPPTKQIIPEDPQPYKGTLYKDRYGKKYTLDQVNDYYDNSTDEIDRFTGKPLIRGLKPLVDLEDAANVTPLGDAISAYDAYTAAKNNDWEGVGAALLSMIPFVPMTVKEYRHLYQGVTPKPSRPNKFKREVPKVNKDITTSQINAEIERRENERYYRAKAKNEGYALAQRLTDDPEYLRRARQVKEQFGDDYTKTYADIIHAYNEDPYKLPSIQFYKSTNDSRAKLATTKEAYDRYRTGSGEFAKLGEYNYWIDPSRTDLSGNVTLHEWNHLVDFLKNQVPSAEGNSNLFYQMSKDLTDRRIDKYDGYYSKLTEQKAYMNQVREYMFENGIIAERGDIVDKETMKAVLNRLSKKDNMKSAVRASKQFKSINKYTKWFNQIPLLGVGAAATYNYANKDSE